MFGLSQRQGDFNFSNRAVCLFAVTGCPREGYYCRQFLTTVASYEGNHDALCCAEGRV